MGKELEYRKILSEIHKSGELLEEASDKITVTNKKTGNTYGVSKSHYKANSDKYEVAGKKGFGSSFPRRFPWYEEGGFGEPAKEVPVKGKVGKPADASGRMPSDISYGDKHDYDEAEDWGHVMSDLLDLAGVPKKPADASGSTDVADMSKVEAPEAEELSSGDKDAMHELNLFLDNTEPLHNQMLSIQKNLERKVKRGVYDPDKAWKLWLYWVDAGAKKYSEDFSTGKDHRKIFPTKLRKALAKQIADEWHAEHLDELEGEAPQEKGESQSDDLWANLEGDASRDEGRTGRPDLDREIDREDDEERQDREEFERFL